MDLFEQITKDKEDFPKVGNVTDDVLKTKLNGYQIIGICILVLGVVLGILFGNTFSTCEASSFFFNNVCTVRKFNFSLMILIWGISFLLFLGLYSIGHIISLLTQINEKLSKFSV